MKMNVNNDAMGNRISKTVINKKPTTDNDKYVTTYYMRDPQGNVLAVYERQRGETGDGIFTLTEQHLYGSSRIGMKKRNLALSGSAVNESTPSVTLYELTNHLSNVVAVISDEDNGSSNDPKVESLTDYYPFGMAMGGRSYNSNDYRFGYTGHEKENDLAEGVYTTQYRLLDTRLGRWMSVDPLFGKYSDMSAYNYCGGNPVVFWDPDGRVLQTTEEDLFYILQTLTKEQREYIKLNDDNTINVELMKEGIKKGVGGNDDNNNYSSLYKIVSNDKVAIFKTSNVNTWKENGDIKTQAAGESEFQDPYYHSQEEVDLYFETLGEPDPDEVGYLQYGYMGATYAPDSHEWTEEDAKQCNMVGRHKQSVSQHYEVLVNNRGNQYSTVKKQMTITTAHELYGHLLFMFEGKNSLHYYVAGGDANTELYNQYIERENEAEANYDGNEE